MGSAPPAAPLPFRRLAGVGAVVFLANAALLVLQLVASRLLAPFIGSDLYTWTAVIGVFLAGIALGNAYGGKLADRYPSPRTLAALLVAGAAAAMWVAVFPILLNATGAYTAVPLGPRIPLLAGVLCLPAGFVLSLLTPLAIKLGLADVSKTGRVTGLVFALSTLGCLLGNYATGFYLVPAFTINTLVYAAAGALLALAAGTFLVLRGQNPSRDRDGSPDPAPPSFLGKGVGGLGSAAFPDIRHAFLVVFLASFGGMTLELVASRLIAPFLGQSLYTWTGIIGVMLAGTALGNLTGGWVADRASRPGATLNPRFSLAATLLAAGGATVFVFIALAVVTRYAVFERWELVGQVLGWTFALFFLPMFALGMVSPQVIRLAVPDVAHVGRVAGRVYAWSTAGAIAGTFATGYFLISEFGVRQTVLGVSLLLAVTSLLVVNPWADARKIARADPATVIPGAVGGGLLLYAFSVVMGGITGGFILTARAAEDDDTVATRETNYYTIKVTREFTGAGDDKAYTGGLKLTLDHLTHSTVRPDDPTYIYYEHEHIQMEFLRAARARAAGPGVLVIGGGGYTFPRFAMEALPETRMDVVEIDPGVTQVARDHLGLKDYPGLRVTHLDGRQFVAERAAAGGYDLVIQDAVNDLSVPSHLMTKEYNDAVKAALKPDGVYLLTVIDSVEYGRLWRAAMATLRRTFPHVELLSSEEVPPADPPPGATPEDVRRWAAARDHFEKNRHVYAIYAAARPLDAADLRAHTAAAGAPSYTHPVPAARLQPFLDRDPGVVLTDQFAPVDNLMADVFRRR